VLLVVVFFATGCLEIISILLRPVALSFRLYGNIFAGENMLDTMSRLIPAELVAAGSRLLSELLMGLVQALVFMLLTAVFTLLIAPARRRDRPPPRLNNEFRRLTCQSREPTKENERQNI